MGVATPDKYLQQQNFICACAYSAHRIVVIVTTMDLKLDVFTYEEERVNDGNETDNKKGCHASDCLMIKCDWHRI